VEPLQVPFIDLGPSHRDVKERILGRIAQTIDRGDFANGEAIGAFEAQFAQYCGVRHCVGVSSGLDALRLGLLASGLEAGAGVIVPAATFAATFEAIVQAGGTPVVVDITDADRNLDVDRLEAQGASGSTHVMPVHLYGQMADMRRVARVATASGLQLIEDACQAHGATRDGIRPGGEARAAAFSFYPTKNLGAMGDAGALATDDEQLAAGVRALREHGETRKYHHEYVGYTARLDTIQASVLLEKLSFLDEWNRQRREAAHFYLRGLAGIDGLGVPPIASESDPVWHLFVVTTPERDGLAAFLGEQGIRTAHHYPEPPHLAPAFRNLGYAGGDFPVAERLAREALSLPLYPGITEAQLAWVCQATCEYFAQR
jgi:dTDP-4-amino-4,6-dideoxygalactose transaminase